MTDRINIVYEGEAKMTLAQRIESMSNNRDFRALMAELVERATAAGLFLESDLRRLKVVHSGETIVSDNMLPPSRADIEAIVADTFDIDVEVGPLHRGGGCHASAKGLDDATDAGLLRSATGFGSTEAEAVQALWRTLTRADKLVLGAYTDSRVEFRWDPSVCRFRRLEVRR